MSRRLPAALAAVVILAAGAHAIAHERKAAGALQFVIGWGEEPAFSGSRNSVSVSISDGNGPLKEAVAKLSVEISFGNERVTLPLEPVFDRPHEYRAWLVPTRPGTYTFHISGTVKGQPVDITSTCSDKTFHCIEDASEIQFPAKDPSPGQLADRLERALPRADRAGETAASARTMAIAALAISVIGLVTAIGLGLRKGRNTV